MRQPKTADSTLLVEGSDCSSLASSLAGFLGAVSTSWTLDTNHISDHSSPHCHFQIMSVTAIPEQSSQIEIEGLYRWFLDRVGSYGLINIQNSSETAAINGELQPGYTVDNQHPVQTELTNGTFLVCSGQFRCPCRHREP